MTHGGELNAAIAKLWSRQRPEMLRRVDVVEDAVASLLEARVEPEQLSEAQRAAHKIAGAAGSFGFGQASDRAREIELALRTGVSLADAPRLSELVLGIRRDFGPETDGDGDGDAQRKQSSAIFDTTAFTADVMIVGGERERAREIQAQLTRRGLRAARAKPGDDTALRSDAPIAVVDLVDPLAHRFMDAAERDADVIVVGLANDAGLDARVAFARRGGRTLLPGDLAPREIAEALVAIRERLEENGARVLVVDDDPALIELVKGALRGRGFDVTSLGDPVHFWQTLEAVNPDLLVLDIEMPGYNGVELCQAVRADPRWAELPVLFLSVHSEPDWVRAAFAAGADDFLAKPVVEDELAQRIDNRLERVRLLRDLAGRDALTGVANRRKASEQLSRLEGLARRYGQPLTLAILDLDHFKQVNDSYGHETGDEVLRRLGRKLQDEFRGEDVVGRWGGEEFVVGMYGMPCEIGVDRLEALLVNWKHERFVDAMGGEFGTTFTAGVAELPSTADSLDELQRAADEALYRGKAAGRSRVVAAGERAAEDVETVDIAVVDDDTALVDLLTHSLSTQGWSVRVVDDGPTAVAVLASEPPLLRARVVLLDWDLPGLDGIAVLRRLRDRGVLRSSRVVMLTARGAESEVLRALELGASDHVTKPFSVPVLVQKLRQVVGGR
jgi:diguanylate cyclase (GGDEF)-like protein